MTTPPRNGHADAETPGGDRAEGIDALIEEALALHADLRDALARTNRLVRALKGQRKPGRLMRAALTALRQLQQVTP